MQPAHIRTARSEGPKAGFNAWVETLERSGLPQVQQQLKELRAQGNKKAQFDFYCAKFGRQFLAQNRAQAAETQYSEPLPASTSSSKVGQLARMLGIGVGKAEQLLGILGEDNGDVDTSLDDVDDSNIGVEVEQRRGPGRPKGSRNKPKETPAATNAADPFEPRNPDANCTSGRLWKLNEAGLLRIVNTPGDPITSGEAHEVIRKVIGGNGN